MSSDQEEAIISGLNAQKILLEEPLGSPDFITLERALMTPPLFDDLFKVVPMVPLFQIQADAKSRHPCCEKFVRFCFNCWNILAILFYPCAVCWQQCIRCCGYVMYYFCLVPSRNCGTYCCHPCLESCWRCWQPCLACTIVCGRGCCKILPEICGTCFGECLYVTRQCFS